MENTTNISEQAPVQGAPNPQSNAKLKTCKSCGASIAKNAKTCPSCGAKNKKPIYKKWYFYLLLLIVLGIVFSAAGGKDDAPKPDTASGDTSPQSTTAATTKSIEYETVSIETLFDDLKSNAYNAQQKWNGQYITITGGKVSNIDASGEYFSIESASEAYWLQSIHVSIPASMRETVMSGISAGAAVTVSCKVTTVGEVMGFVVDATEVLF